LSPSRPFILRPVATLAIDGRDSSGRYCQLYAATGVGAATGRLSNDSNSDVYYPGASPDVVATTVTAPLERQFGQLQGLNQMTSSSSGGTSVIVLQFTLNLNIDVAEEEVQSAINAAQSFLPPTSLPLPSIARQILPTRRC